MKAEFDREVDALLRRSARAAGRAASAARGPEQSAHLDADELSAFAENALPVAARLAAATHLSDCDACRGIVVNLARASGAGVEMERRVAGATIAAARDAARSGGWLAALFSPRVLRFAAPALALCLVGTVAFVLLRARRDASSVAQRVAAPEPPRPGAGIGAADDAGANMNANTETAGTSANMSANVAAPPVYHDQTPSREGQPAPSASAQEPEAPDGSADHAEVARKQPADAAASGGGAPASPRPVVAEAPAPAAAAAPPPPPLPAARDAAQERKEDARRDTQDELARGAEGPQERRVNQAGNLDYQQSPDGARNRSGSSVYDGAGARSVPSAPRRSSRAQTAPRSRAKGEGETREEAESAAETRAAAGHRFRREGGVWVDVNYRPSMSMTGVRRGTEAFRALVADIPELGRIAEQLPGEVIAVVRGRAYRIR